MLIWEFLIVKPSSRHQLATCLSSKYSCSLSYNRIERSHSQEESILGTSELSLLVVDEYST